MLGTLSGSRAGETLRSRLTELRSTGQRGSAWANTGSSILVKLVDFRLLPTMREQHSVEIKYRRHFPLKKLILTQAWKGSPLS